eukprot:1185559-Prorocentrum_minimum.AAC.1
MSQTEDATRSPAKNSNELEHLMKAIRAIRESANDTSNIGGNPILTCCSFWVCSSCAFQKYCLLKKSSQVESPTGTEVGTQQVPTCWVGRKCWEKSKVSRMCYFRSFENSEQCRHTTVCRQLELSLSCVTSCRHNLSGLSLSTCTTRNFDGDGPSGSGNPDQGNSYVAAGDPARVF